MTTGEVSFKLKVSAKMAPAVQIVAYAVLPSDTVIAHSADFSTEKCFSHKVDSCQFRCFVSDEGVVAKFIWAVFRKFNMLPM